MADNFAPRVKAILKENGCSSCAKEGGFAQSLLIIREVGACLR
jgi:hypothetical protein